MERTRRFSYFTVPASVRLSALLGAWAVTTFAILRSPWMESRLLLPFAEWQGAIVSWYLGVRALPIEMAPDCSGLDVMLLTIGAALVYPVPIGRRIRGGLGALAVLFAANLIRIAALGHAVGSPAFGALHLYIWPAVLTLVAVGYLGLWLWRIERVDRETVHGLRRYAWPGALLVGYLAALPFLIEAGVLDAYAADVARIAALILRAIGVAASVNGRVLQTSDVTYLITYECVTTPLLPVYAGAVIAAPWRRTVKAAALATAFPLFALLSVIRLVTLALPPVLFGSRLFLTHAFHQLVLAAALVICASAGRRATSSSGTFTRTMLAIGAGVITGLTAGSIATAILGRFFPGALADAGDVQGALLILPSFEIALFAALAVALDARDNTGRWAIAGGALVASLPLTLFAAPYLRAVASPDVAALIWRGVAVAVPALGAVCAAHPWRR